MNVNKNDNVLIVGAGPTGMVLASELARRGIGFRLVDKRKGPTSIPRAFTLHAKTMEMFEHMGIAHQFLSSGIKSSGFNFNFKGKPIRPTLEFTTLDSAYPYTLIYDQSETDKHLREHLETMYDVRPEWGAELTELTQKEGRCRAVLGRSDATKHEVFEPTWVVGCDGVRSFVREAAELDLSGGNYDGMAMEMMDTKLEGFDGEDERLHYFISKENFLLVTKLPTGYYRLGVSGMSVKEGEGSTLTRRERFQNLINEHLDGVVVAEPHLERKWEVWRRIAKNYRNGNIFLAGDAAHVHSPAGGQGMNVSMQDAFNLAWKLALVVRGSASHELLDTYAAERLPVGEQVLAGTDALHEIIMAHGQGMEDRVKLTQREGWKEKTVARISGLSYNYCDTMTLPAELKLENGITPGGRAPNVRLTDHAWMFDVLRHPRLSLLIAYDNDRDTTAVHKLSSDVSGRYGELIQVIVIEESKDFASRYGSFGEPHIYLVRPDGYIACHCLTKNFALLFDYLNQWFFWKPKHDTKEEKETATEDKLFDLIE